MDTLRIPERPRCLAPIAAAVCVVLVVSNICAVKALQIPGFSFITMDGGNILFPISYILGDLVVEVYGYRRARQVIWLGFALNLLAVLTFCLVVALPAAPDWEMQDAFAQVLSQTPRIVLGSLCGFIIGSLLNARIMVWLKKRTQGRHLWVRTIGSTIVGEAADSAVFILISFGGIWSLELMFQVIFWNFVIKTLIEIGFTPLTYLAIHHLRRAEGVA